MKTLLAASLALLLSACAMAPAKFQPGADSKQFARDDYECERDARALPNADSCSQMDMYERCMKVRGYEPIAGSANKGLCAKVF